MIRIAPRETLSPARAVAARIAAGFVALLLAAVPIAAAGAPVFEAYALMARGALGSLFAV